MFFPSASSPLSVEGPSAITSPLATCSPFSTIGLWLIQVPWFERLNLISLYSSKLPSFFLIIILSAVTFSTIPSFLAQMQTPESFAARYSIPVPTIGESVLIRGTA